jgi:2-methylcitrate dehydratase
VASVLGSAARISTEGAALVNGVLVRDLDLNDTHVGKEPCHPSENIPAALACCEEAGRSGRELIETIVLGYEAQLAFNSAFAFGERGLFSVSAAGFVVPLMAGKAWRLPVQQVVEAIGISGVRQLTLLAITRGPISMMKALPYAHNAMDGLFATRLAAGGFTGPGNAMDWFLKEVKPAEPDLRLDLRKFRIGEVGLKRFPLQFELQTIAEAGVNLHARARERIGEIAQIVVETYPITIERTASPSRYDPKTRETADHSLPVCLAMALLDGEVTIAQYEHERWRAGEVLGLARKVAVKTGERLAQGAPRGSGAIVKLEFRDGTSLEEIVPIADGDARRPMSRAALEQKFRSLAVPTLGEAGAARVLGLVERLETLPDLQELTAALRGA